MFERDLDNLRFLLRELDSWARDGLVSSPLRDVLAGPYRERLDALEREASGKEAVYLQESYGEWLARLGTVAVLTGFSVIAAVSLGLFTPGQKVALVALAAALFVGVAEKRRALLGETLAVSLLFIGGSLAIAAASLLYHFSFVGAGGEAALQLVLAAGLVKVSARFNSAAVLLQAYAVAVGAGSLIVDEEVVAEPVMLVVALAACALAGWYAVTRSMAALGFAALVSCAAVVRAAELTVDGWPHEWAAAYGTLVPYCLLLVAVAALAERRFGRGSGLPLYVVGCAGAVLCWWWFIYYLANTYLAPPGGEPSQAAMDAIELASCALLGLGFLRLGRWLGQNIVIAAGGIVLLYDLGRVAQVLELPPIVIASLLLAAGLAGLYLAWSFDVRRRAALERLGVRGERDVAAAQAAEGVAEGVATLIER